MVFHEVNGQFSLQLRWLDKCFFLEASILLPYAVEMLMAYHDFLRVAKCSMSCHTTVAYCHCCAFWALRLLFNSFSFVSFLVNSCQFSLPTVFIKLSFFLPSSNFLHLISFSKRNQITKDGWKFVKKEKKKKTDFTDSESGIGYSPIQKKSTEV